MHKSVYPNPSSTDTIAKPHDLYSFDTSTTVVTMLVQFCYNSNRYS